MAYIQNGHPVSEYQCFKQFVALETLYINNEVRAANRGQLPVVIQGPSEDFYIM